MYLQHKDFTCYYTPLHKGKTIKEIVSEILNQMNLEQYQGQNFVIEIYFDNYWFATSITIYDWSLKQSTHEFGGDFNSDFFAVENFGFTNTFEDLVTYFSEQHTNFKDKYNL